MQEGLKSRISTSVFVTARKHRSMCGNRRLSANLTQNNGTSGKYEVGGSLLVVQNRTVERIFFDEDVKNRMRTLLMKKQVELVDLVVLKLGYNNESTIYYISYFVD